MRQNQHKLKSELENKAQRANKSKIVKGNPTLSHQRNLSQPFLHTDQSTSMEYLKINPPSSSKSIRTRHERLMNNPDE